MNAKKPAASALIPTNAFEKKLEERYAVVVVVVVKAVEGEERECRQDLQTVVLLMCAKRDVLYACEKVGFRRGRLLVVKVGVLRAVMWRKEKTKRKKEE